MDPMPIFQVSIHCPADQLFAERHSALMHSVQQDSHAPAAWTLHAKGAADVMQA